MGVAETIALTLGVGWACGLNLYAAVAALGLLHRAGHLVLPPDLLVLADPLVLAAALVLYAVEFFADKVPGVDTAWDAVHTPIRIPAGALLAAGAVGDLSPAAEVAAGLAGGTLAAGTHFLKAGGRVLLHAASDPVGRWTASLAEDAAVLAGLLVALFHPWILLGLLVVFVVLASWLLPGVARGLRGAFAIPAGWLRRPAADPGPGPGS